MIRKKALKVALYLSIIATILLISAVWAMPRSPSPAKVVGIFWQPTLDTKPSGNWDLLGVNTFVPQFGVADGKSWLKTTKIPQWEPLPNWSKIQKQAWSKNLILGLSGQYDEQQARAHVADHGKISLQFIQEQSLTRKPIAYYFPVEADPSWLGVSVLGKTLEKLPKPLWVSIYSAKTEPFAYDSWLASWLPNQTHVFFQDGVGTGVRSPAQARKILENLQQKFGKDRIVIVLEAFRPKSGGGFRAAYPWEIIQQLDAYQNQKVFIFDGPHYLSRPTVYVIALWQKLHIQ